MLHPGSFTGATWFERDRKWWLLAGMSMACIVVTLDYFVLMVALPTIKRDLDASTPAMAWAINAYVLAFAALLVTGGRLADIYGRRRLFLIGLVVFAAASASGGLSWAPWWMIVSRAVQGVGVALFFPASLSIVNSGFAAAERDQAISAWSGIGSTGAALGPIVGGLFAEHLSWRWIFFFNIPIAALAIVVTLAVVEESRDETAPRSVDIPGILTVTGGLLLLMLGLDQGDDWGWVSPGLIGSFAGAAGLLCAFVLIDLRTRSPLVAFGLLRRRTFVGANLVGFLQNFAFAGMMLYLTLYLQNVLSYSPVRAGLMVVPSATMFAVISIVGGRLVERVGARVLLAGGMALVAVTLLALSRFDVDTRWGWIITPLTFNGLGLGLVYTLSATAGMKAAPESQAGAASGILNMFKLVGAAFGIALTQVVFEELQGDRLDTLLARGVARATADRESFVHAFSGAMLFIAVLATVGVVFALALIRDRPAAEPAPLPMPAPSSAAGD